MKKNLIITFLIIILGVSNNCVFALSQSETISKIENDLYGFEYSKDSNQNRVARLEKTIYGKASSGDLGKRIKKLSGDVSADVIGLEIPPTEDTFREEEVAQADNTVNYPVVNDVEQKLFNQTYKNKDLHSRIVAIERKLFNKIYDVDDYPTRLDRIKAEVMPETLANTSKFDREYRDNRVDRFDDNTLTSADLSGLNQNRFTMPFGQRNYTRPYTNYGDNTMTGGAMPVVPDRDLENQIAQMEQETFGTEFANDDMKTRVKRLNSVNKAKQSSSRYDSQKFNQRMSTAMEIGAMILMILAMVL